jgi:serine/threonine protein kinase
MKTRSGSAQNNAADSLEALVGQVADEFTERVRKGEHPQVEEYAARYPQIAAVLRQVLPALQVMGDPARESLAASEAEDPLAALRGCLGDFHLLREIGRGGMGIVYEAEQLSLNRRVALKILPFAAALDPKQLQRFKNEAQAAAQLHHTNIVPVFGVGCERGVHYYAMQFIEGRTLAAVVAELRQQIGLDKGDSSAAPSPVAQDLLSGRLAPVKRVQGEGPPTTPYVPCEPARAPIGDTTPRADLSTERSITTAAYLRTVAHLGAQAAKALEHAHQLGVVHRDIKPANLLIDIRGNLWITDFGLAHCQSQAGLTMTGDLVGTLRYMSPEQALAKRLLIDHRTDIYSLGVTLYELLTLEPAFGGNDREELLQQIAFHEPLALRQRNKAIPRELETIVLKAMEKSPEARYATAQELADDLRRFLEYKPIRAKRPRLVQRATKWCRRNPLLAGALTAVAVTLFLGTVVAWALVMWALSEQGRAKETAAELTKKSAAVQTAEEKAARQLYAASVLNMAHAWENHNILDLQDQLVKTAEFPERDFEWYYWQRLCHAESVLLAGHIGGVTTVAFALDSKRVATGGKDGTVRIWDATSGQERFCLQGHQNEVTGVAFAPGGQWLVSSSTDGTARLWDAASGQQLRILQRPNRSPVWTVAITPDSRRVITGNEDSTATVWDAVSGQECFSLSSLPVLATSIAGLMISPQALVLATSVLYSGSAGHTGPVWAVAVSPDGKRFVTGGQDNLLMLWDAASGRHLRTFLGHETVDHGGINSIAVSTDSKRLMTAGNDNSGRVWDIDTGRGLFTVRRDEGWEVSVAVTPDGQRLVLVYLDRSNARNSARMLGEP